MANSLLRSWLFVPGNRPRFIEKALGVSADAIFLELEDGVPVAEKPAARELVVAALGRHAGGVMQFVRVNSMRSPWFDDDLEAILHTGLAGICLPKVESPRQVEVLAGKLEAFEESANIADPIRIIASIESAASLVNAPAIAASHERLVALMLGAEDFALDLGLGTNREGEARELLYARSAVVIAAAAANLFAIDGVYPQLEDDEGLLQDARQARRLGFRAKSTFHPGQIAIINDVFSPSTDEIEYAQRVIAAFDGAVQRGDGAVAVGGQLVDQPVVQRARQLLASAQLLACTGDGGEAC